MKKGHKIDTTTELMTCDDEPLRDRKVTQPVSKCAKCGQVLAEEKSLRVARVFIEALMFVEEGKKLKAEEHVARYSLGEKVGHADEIVVAFDELKLLRETLLVRYGSNPVIVGFCWPLLEIDDKEPEEPTTEAA